MLVPARATIAQPPSKCIGVFDIMCDQEGFRARPWFEGREGGWGTKFRQRHHYVGLLSSGGAWARGWGLGGVPVRAAFARVGLQFLRFGGLRRVGLHGPLWRLLSVLVLSASPRWAGRPSSAVARPGPAAPSRGGFRTPSVRLVLFSKQFHFV